MNRDDQILPEEYEEREQAFVKHKVLSSYLMRLLMIVGNRRADTIGFVDGFAGPWKSNTADLSDTSIGISIDRILAARDGFKEQGWNVPRFKALYVEKDRQRYEQLQSYITDRQATIPQDVELNAWHGDFIDRLDEVLGCFRRDDFVFFFVDPTGWKQISMEKLRPLLERENTEILINFMYDFVNRAAHQEAFEQHMEQMFGDFHELGLTEIQEPVEREVATVKAYREHLTSALPVSKQFRTAYVRIKDQEADKAKYHLVYLTRHWKGIVVFMHESEKVEREIQPAVRAEAAVRREIEEKGQPSLFSVPMTSSRTARPAERDLREVWLKRISDEPRRFTEKDEAALLEETDCFPADLQEALRTLIEDGLVENLDAKGHRPKNVVNFRNEERLQRTQHYMEAQ